MNTPLPSNEFLNDLDTIRKRMGAVKKIRTDPKITSIRLVVNPEKMVINETKRAYTYLCLYNLTVECLVINRLIPEEARDSYPAEKMEGTGEVHGDDRRSYSALSPCLSPICSRQRWWGGRS